MGHAALAETYNKEEDTTKSIGMHESRRIIQPLGQSSDVYFLSEAVVASRSHGGKQENLHARVIPSSNDVRDVTATAPTILSYRDNAPCHTSSALNMLEQTPPTGKSRQHESIHNHNKEFDFAPRTLLYFNEGVQCAGRADSQSSDEDIRDLDRFQNEPTPTVTYTKIKTRKETLKGLTTARDVDKVRFECHEVGQVCSGGINKDPSVVKLDEVRADPDELHYEDLHTSTVEEGSEAIRQKTLSLFDTGAVRRSNE